MRELIDCHIHTDRCGHAEGTLAQVVAAGVDTGVSAMVITASGTGRLLVLLGALTFMISDTVLGLDRFVGPRANARMVVIVTCHLGQAMMVIGALR